VSSLPDFWNAVGSSDVKSYSREGTPGEWMEDPYGDFGQVPAGPGEKWFPPDHALSSSL
jgi:hypothetical protein